MLIDWEHSITDKMERNKGELGFPRPEDFGITEDDVKNYVYDKQRILDREEERKTNLVVPGIILVMPVIILSGFGNSMKILLAGVFAGVALMILYFAIVRFLDRCKLKKMYDERIENFIQVVTNYKEDA